MVEPDLWEVGVVGSNPTTPTTQRWRPGLRIGDRIDAEDPPKLAGERCAVVGGVSLHANVAVPARDRPRLERLCRHVARPPLAMVRFSRLHFSVYGIRRSP